MIQVNVKCPKCGHSLMEKGHKIDGKPAIMVKFSYAAKKGSAYLSSLYGSYNSELPFAIPEHKVAGFRCPHCDADLKTDRKCDVCGSHMVALDLTQGGNVQFCSRKGCRKHLLEFSDFDTELEAFYKAYAHQLDA